MYNYQKTILNAHVEVANELANIKNLMQINVLKKQQSDATGRARGERCDGGEDDQRTESERRATRHRTTVRFVADIATNDVRCP